MKYSIEELDIMRKCIVSLYCPRPTSDFFRGYPNIKNWQEQVEAMLRTFMQNGTSHKELINECEKKDIDYKLVYLKYGVL